MSRAVLLTLALGACGGGTSLDGPVACGSSTCKSGQVCRDYHGEGIDSGTPGGGGPHYDCADVPSSCELADCSFGCAPCVNALCYPTSASSLTGRQLVCLVQ